MLESVAPKPPTVESRRTKKIVPAKKTPMKEARRLPDGDSGSGSDSDDNDEDIYLRFGKVLSMDESAQIAPCQLDVYVSASLQPGLASNATVNMDSHLPARQMVNGQRWRSTGDESVLSGLAKSGKIPCELLQESEEDERADSLDVDMSNGESVPIGVDGEEMGHVLKQSQLTAYFESTLPAQTLSGLSLDQHLELCRRHLSLNTPDIALARFVYELIEKTDWQGLPLDQFTDMQVSAAVSFTSFPCICLELLLFS